MCLLTSPRGTSPVSVCEQCLCQIHHRMGESFQPVGTCIFCFLVNSRLASPVSGRNKGPSISSESWELGRGKKATVQAPALDWHLDK